MQTGRFRSRYMQNRGRRVSELDAEVIAIRVKFLHDGSAGSQARVQFLACIVIDQIELNVLIAATLAGLCIYFPQQVELSALISLHFRLGRFGGWLVIRGSQE